MCIADPSDKRRALLESSRSLISSLKILEEYLELKEAKRKLFFDVHTIFDEISVLNYKLEAKLPKSPAPKVERRAKSISLPEIKSSGSPRLDKLEAELSKIEQKLGSLQ